MSLSRRKTLALIGGGTLLAATGAVSGFVLTREPAKALAPWRQAGGRKDARLEALSYAILAPNPHNRQPWLVELTGDETVVLHRDRTRSLPETDPDSRQLVIGLGCFLELMKIAASATGHTVEETVFPEGEDGPVAVARFGSGATRDPLFDHVLARRSCKEPYEDRPVPENLAKQLSPFARTITDPAMVARLRDLTWKAWKTEAITHRTLKESVDLMRFGKSEIEANPDGIDLGGPFLESLMLMGLLDRESQLDPESQGFREGVKMYREMLLATPAYATITSPRNGRADQIEAGRKWLRLNLTTTALGLALHPVSQALQEFAEMRTHYESAHKLLAEPGHTVQMLGRLGFGPEVAPSPRWPLETRLIDG